MLSRRLFCQSIPAACLSAVSGSSEALSAADLLWSYSVLSDLHCSTKPDSTKLEIANPSRNYRACIEKLCLAVTEFNHHQLDFVVELGDFKDCKILDGEANRLEALNFLREIETEFSKTKALRYHACGNHDFDVNSVADYMNVLSSDIAGLLYYQFQTGGITGIVLDGCYDANDRHYE